MRILLLALCLLMSGSAASSLTLQVPSWHTYVPDAIVCTDASVANVIYSLARKDTMQLNHVLETIEFLPGKELPVCERRPVNVSFTFLTDSQRGLVNGRPVRWFYFIAYDTYRQKMVYVIGRDMLKERIAQAPHARGAFFLPLGILLPCNRRTSSRSTFASPSRIKLRSAN